MRRSIVTFALLLAAACGPRSSAGGASPLGRAVITEQELTANAGMPVYDLIQRIRPEYLRARPSQNIQGRISAPPPAVVVNGQLRGSVSELRQVSAGLLVLVRHYGIEEAKRTFGMQYEGGVIELTYRELVPPPPPS
jgi:hypothetical protein